MCKFSQYRDKESARAAAFNASWDMLFLRMMRHSELGLPPYAGYFGVTTLLTFDSHFAESARALMGAFLGVGSGSAVGASGAVARLNEHLQHDVARDARMMARLNEWARQCQKLQHERIDCKPAVDRATLDTMVHQALGELFS